MTTAAAPETLKAPPSVRRFGYGVSIAFSIALLVVVNNLLSWEVFTWITAEFSDVVPALNVAIAVGIAANVLYMVSDVRRIRALGELATTGVGLVALIVMLTVFPFEFAVYSFDWEFAVKAVLVIAIVGSVVGIIVSAAKLVSPQAGQTAGKLY